MKLLHSFFFIIILIPNFSFGQDDYVNEKPIKNRNLLEDSLPNPDYTNYFINSSALTLKKESIRLSNSYILFTKGSYGLTDNSTISVGLSLIGTFTGSFKQMS